MSDIGAGIDRSSPVATKIALFRSLFRGREDVYPRRFESRKTGKSGYAPACANEWVRGICEKPRIKCAVCPHRHFLPVTVVRYLPQMFARMQRRSRRQFMTSTHSTDLLSDEGIGLDEVLLLTPSVSASSWECAARPFP